MLNYNGNAGKGETILAISSIGFIYIQAYNTRKMNHMIQHLLQHPFTLQAKGPIPSAILWYVMISKVRLTRGRNCKYHMLPCKVRLIRGRNCKYHMLPCKVRLTRDRNCKYHILPCKVRLTRGRNCKYHIMVKPEQEVYSPVIILWQKLLGQWFLHNWAQISQKSNNQHLYYILLLFIYSTYIIYMSTYIIYMSTI